MVHLGRAAPLAGAAGWVASFVLLAGCTASTDASPTQIVVTPGSSADDEAGPSAAPVASAGAEPESAVPEPTTVAELTFTEERYAVPAGSHPHDVAPAADGGIWYTAQHTGELGWLDPETGEVQRIPLGSGSAPHGVIVGPDDAAWITDTGQNAILRVTPTEEGVRGNPVPTTSPAGLNTAAFDGEGVLWFTGNAGWYGSVDGRMVNAFEAPRGAGPYGIAATPEGEIWFSSLQGRYLADVDEETGEARVIDPPSGSGLRRVWSDSTGRLWVSEWDAGMVGVYDPATDEWREWRLPGDAPQPYAVYVDETDAVWLSDFGANSIVRFDPRTETFRSFPAPHVAAVRQLLGRPGEVWGAESAADQLIVIRYGP